MVTPTVTAVAVTKAGVAIDGLVTTLEPSPFTAGAITVARQQRGAVIGADEVVQSRSAPRTAQGRTP